MSIALSSTVCKNFCTRRTQTRPRPCFRDARMALAVAVEYPLRQNCLVSLRSQRRRRDRCIDAPKAFGSFQVRQWRFGGLQGSAGNTGSYPWSACRLQQPPVRQSAPSHRNRFDDEVAFEPSCDTAGRTVIKENAHVQASAATGTPAQLSQGFVLQNAKPH